jgi:HEAT repeat protein
MVSTAPDTKVADFVRGLALAWKNLAAYPTGHPALTASLESVHARLNDLRGPAGDVVLGIAADGLLYGQTKIDSLYAQKLAHALHVRGVALMRFSLETTARDLESFLRLISAAQGRPLAEELTAAGVLNIYLQHVDYSAVQMTSDLDAPPPPKPEATLWEEILRALLAGRELSAEGEARESGMVSVDELAAMIVQTVEDAQPQAEFDPNATFGVKFTAPVPESPDARMAKVTETVALYVAGATGARKRVAMQQVLQLLRALPQAIRETVLRAVTAVLAADDDPAPLREFAAELAADEVLDALQYLAGASLSEHAMLLLRSLINAREQTQAAAAPSDVAGELITLFGDDDIDRFNPPDHKALLEQVSIDIPTVVAVHRSIHDLGVRVDSVADDVLNRQLSRTLIDLLASRGTRDAEPALARLDSLFRSFLAGGAYGDALETIDRLQALNVPLERFADISIIRMLVETLHDAPPENAAVIKQLTERLGIISSRALLIALADENNLGRRRRLFDFAVSLGPAIVPAATQFLADERWFVVRNMVILLRTVNDRTSLAEIRRIANHNDLRVRMEAIKSLLALDPTVDRALLDEAIHARDPKLAETAIMLVGNYGIKEAVDPLLRMIGGRDVFGARRILRILAIKTLGELAVPAALPPMQRFFRDSWLPWPSKEERRAAYESLASYPPEARAALVEKGLKSRDPAIRAICRRLAGVK